MSFQTSKRIILSELKWMEDALGEYWGAKFLDTRTCEIGRTGTYDIFCVDGLRPSRERQEAELSAYAV